MQTFALIVIRVIGTLCGLGCLLGVGGLIYVECTQPTLVPDHRWSLLAGLFLALLGSRVCWLVWRQLTPMAVRRLSFLVGLLSWFWIASKFSALADTQSPLPTVFGLYVWELCPLLVPIAVAMTIGCVFSHVFRRALFPIMTPPTAVERFLQRKFRPPPSQQ